MRTRRGSLRRDRLRRSIYLLPNLFTALNLFCGFFAMVAAIDGKFVAAAYAIIVAGIFDNLDGKIARVTHSTSKFGVEFDSLCDLVSFGVAPGLMMYLWALQPLGRIGWLAGFLFVACGALRLARFNTQVGTVDSRYFVGLPIPAGAGMNAVTILFCHKVGVEPNAYPLVFLIMLYTLSFLMVSTIKYPSFKNADVLRNKNFNVLVAAILVLIFIAAQPPVALFLFGVMYISSGPIVTLRHQRLARRQAEDGAQEEDQKPSPL
ncbi:MAG: CDP-diacylglycerol--serine O-phosphatidyltransferase [Desulfobacteraceae bacterium]